MESPVKITRCRLEGYQRLQLNNINVFDYTPEKTNQLIIGTNGSGKSSVIKELSPLPAEPSEYSKDGSKTVWAEHRNVRYILKSVFSPGTKHSFIRIYGDTEEELNDGGTVTVQKELVKKHFGLTKEIHDLMLGKRSFTKMGTGERKDWFTRLSNANFDYAINFYQKIRDRMNDTVGAMKTAKKRIVTETTKVISDEARSQLRDEVQELHKVLDELLDRRRPIDIPLYELDSRQNVIDDQLKDNVNKVRSCLKRIETTLPIETLTEQHQEAVSHIRAAQVLGDGYFKRHEELSKLFTALEKTHTQNIANIEADVTALEAEKKSNFEKRLVPVTFEVGYDYLVEELAKAKRLLLPILEVLVPNADKAFSRDSLNAQRACLESKTTDLQLIRNKASDNANLLRHYEALRSAGEITCPKCTHKWINHYDQNKVDNLAINATQLENATVILQKQIDSTNDYIRTMLQYFEHFTAYNQAISQLRALEPFWSHIHEKNLLLISPSHVANLFLQLETDFSLIKRDEVIATTIREKLSLIRLTEETAGLNYDNCKSQKEELETTIFNNDNLLKNLRAEAEYLNTQIKSRNEMLVLEEKITELLAIKDSLLKDSIETLRRSHYNELIRHFQSILARKEQALQESDVQARIIADIQYQITQYEFEANALKLAAKELSPTEGIIAEGLFGFMKIFVNRMNMVIQKIWTYPLVVQPCKLGSDNQVDLDYKFPMMVDNKEPGRKDVSEGSSAMEEVVNLAFRITGLKALHLGDYPLFLDEFGHSMDPTHKAATIHLVNTIMTDEAFSQLFMISHDAIQYGALSNTQICVLCDANVIVPKGTIYNEHVVMR